MIRGRRRSAPRRNISPNCRHGPLTANPRCRTECRCLPALHSCRSETFSTLRFAKRAKAIQNKAVVNEETEDDVNVLREQIGQLKDELVRMKSKDQTTGGSNNNGYTSSWNARRSVDILRQSLNLPLKLPSSGGSPMCPSSCRYGSMSNLKDEDVNSSECNTSIIAAKRSLAISYTRKGRDGSGKQRERMFSAMDPELNSERRSVRPANNRCCELYTYQRSAKRAPSKKRRLDDDVKIPFSLEMQPHNKCYSPGCKT